VQIWLVRTGSLLDVHLPTTSSPQPDKLEVDLSSDVERLSSNQCIRPGFKNAHPGTRLSPGNNDAWVREGLQGTRWTFVLRRVADWMREPRDVRGKEGPALVLLVSGD
jgi:hypothetical protein